MQITILYPPTDICDLSLHRLGRGAPASVASQQQTEVHRIEAADSAAGRDVAAAVAAGVGGEDDAEDGARAGAADVEDAMADAVATVAVVEVDADRHAWRASKTCSLPDPRRQPR